MKASVVISTRNRVVELREALSSVTSQSIPCEIIVQDDASSDGTAEMVRSEFPSARLESSSQARGYIAQRNRGAALATGEVVFSIDDDAVFTTSQVVSQTLSLFSESRIGAVAIPYSDVNKDNIIRQLAPDRSDVWVTDRFIGTAHAIRRETFLHLGGYRECFVHQGEEGDLCLRMLAQGLVVALGQEDLIHHFESPKRDLSRMDFYGRRNDVLFATLNVPGTWLFAHLMGTLWNGLRWAVSCRRYRHMLAGMAAGLADGCRLSDLRKPVPAQVYHLHRRLKRRGPLRLRDIRFQLPAAPSGSSVHLSHHPA